jgi:hypothetical protein
MSSMLGRFPSEASVLMTDMVLLKLSVQGKEDTNGTDVRDGCSKPNASSSAWAKNEQIWASWL